MKKLFVALSLLTAMGFAACQSNEKTNNQQTNSEATTANDEEKAEEVKPQFANVDSKVSSHIQDVFNHYIHVKTALVNSNSAEAKNGATAITNVINGFDKSLLPADQKGEYDKSIEGIRNGAQSIANENNLEKQRENFAGLSNNVYALVKAFGTDKPVYHDHCPMALNDKGAMWLSESKEIKNPYFGSEMMECGTVEEIIQK